MEAVIAKDGLCSQMPSVAAGPSKDQSLSRWHLNRAGFANFATEPEDFTELIERIEPSSLG